MGIMETPIPFPSNYINNLLKGLVPNGNAQLGFPKTSGSPSVSGTSGFSFPNIFHPGSVSLTLPPDVLHLFFWFGVGLFALMCLIFFYVWGNFEFDKIRVRLMTLVYFFGGLAILASVYGAIAVYSNSL